MKNKFLILTLCFTVLFSSLNLNNSYADGFNSRMLGSTISVPMLGVVSTVAVACGVVLDDVDDIYNLGLSFYNKYKDNWEKVNQVFGVAVSVGVNGVVNVGNEFLNYITDFLQDKPYQAGGANGFTFNGYIGLLPVYSRYAVNHSDYLTHYLELIPGKTYNVAKGITIDISSSSDGFAYPNATVNGSYLSGSNKSVYLYDGKARAYVTVNDNLGLIQLRFVGSSLYFNLHSYGFSPGSVTGSPNVSGLSFDNVNSSKKEDDSLDVLVPGNLGSLVGSSSSSVVLSPGSSLNPSYDLPVDGVVTVPGVSNPSVDVDSSVTLPNVNTGDNVGDNVGSTTWDWLINLVVPSSAYWANTFDTFFTNIGNAFPMININRFKDLCINGVPPQDIEVTIMGAKGKIFNTKYLNSIIDWLQPIVSAFMAFLLMLYNYRKVYKLIRGFEPFSGIADGNSVGEVRGKMDGAMPEMGGSSFVGPSTSSTWSDGQSVTRGSIQSRYYGRDL